MEKTDLSKYIEEIKGEMKMPLWGASEGLDEGKPRWLSAEQKRNCYATDSGWVYKDPNTGVEEVLACIGELSDSLGSASISDAYLLPRNNYGSNFSINVVYNEAVSVTGVPVIELGGTYAGGNGNCSFYAGNNTNQLEFRYVPVTGDDDYSTITIPDTITMDSGVNIVTVANTWAQAESNLEAAGYNGAINVKPTVGTNYIIKDIPVPLSANINSRISSSDNLVFTINYSNAVWVDETSGYPYILLGKDQTGTHTNVGDLRANYAGGNATTSLTFTYNPVTGDSIGQGSLTYNNHSIVLNSACINAVAALSTAATINLETASWTRTVNVLPSLATVAVIKT